MTQLQQAARVREGDVRCVVSAKWWRAWKLYVGFDTATNGVGDGQNGLEAWSAAGVLDVGCCFVRCLPCRHSHGCVHSGGGCVLHSTLLAGPTAMCSPKKPCDLVCARCGRLPSYSQVTTTTTATCHVPGPISSKELEDPTVPGALKPGIRLGVDYVVWPESLWDRMVQLYGATACACFRRRLVRSHVARASGDSGADSSAAGRDVSAQPSSSTKDETAAGASAGNTTGVKPDDASAATGGTEKPSTVAGEGGQASTAGDGNGAPGSGEPSVADAADKPSTTNAGAPSSQQTGGAKPSVTIHVQSTVHVRSASAGDGGAGASAGAGGSAGGDAAEAAPDGAVGLASVRRGSVRLCDDPERLELELYPQVLYIHICSLQGRPVAHSEFAVIVSRMTLKMELKAVVAKHRGVPVALCRLYYQHKETRGQWAEVPSGGLAGGVPCTDFGTSYRFMLEVAYLTREGTNAFARDYVKTGAEFWRFAPRDRVDAQDFQGKWFPGVITAVVPSPQGAKLRVCAV